VLCGSVDAIHEGAVNAEVTIRLPGGDVLASIITEKSLQRLELKVNDHICAVFKASSVILAIE
jgi:molybdate transport system regulatory protein